MTPEERAFLKEQIAVWRSEVTKARADLELFRKAGFLDAVAKYEDTIKDLEKRLAQASAAFGG